MEQVKRENKLWTNDSLFLREHLLIPVAAQDISNIPDDSEVVVIDNAPRSRSGTGASDTKSRTSSQNSVNSVDRHKASENDCDKSPEPSGMDFLSRFDNSMAEIKSSVNRMEKNSRLV